MIDQTGIFYTPPSENTGNCNLWCCSNCGASYWIERGLVACACGNCGLGGDNLINVDAGSTLAAAQRAHDALYDFFCEIASRLEPVMNKLAEIFPEPEE